MQPTVRAEAPAALDRRYQGLRVPLAPARRTALSKSLERHGQQQPLLVSDAVERNRLVLLDGFKRVELLEERGAERVWVAVVELDGPSSLAAMVAANADRRGLSDLEEAWIIASLHRDHGLDQSEIATLFGRHKSWVCRRLSLHARLERAVQDDVRLGLISISAAREIARLPRGNQAALAKAVSAHGLSCKNVARLVGELRRADPEARREILRDPLAHLPAPSRSATAAGRDARLSQAGNAVREQLLRIHGAASRLDAILYPSLAESFGAREKALLGELAAPIAERTRAVLFRVEVLVGAAKEAAHAA